MERFATYDDLQKYNVTIEEREEYEQHLKMGTVVYAGVDYEAILREVGTGRGPQPRRPSKVLRQGQDAVVREAAKRSLKHCFWQALWGRCHNSCCMRATQRKTEGIASCLQGQTAALRKDRPCLSA